MSRVMIPEMERRGYTREFSGALTVTAGLLGPIIPPSMLMIIYGILAVQPIAPLFIAGIVPGLLIVVGLALVIAFAALVQGTLPQGETTARSEAARILARGLFPLLIPLLVISGILAGATTPTEAGGVGAFFAIILGLAYRDLKLRDFPSILLEVALSTATVTALIGVAAVCSWVLAFDGVPDRMVEMMRTSTQSPEAFLLLVAAVLLVLGMFLEGISVMVVVVPLLVPVATTLGINPLHFGVVVTVATVIGLVTPPVGPGLYIVMAATGVPMGRLFKAAVPFLLAVVMVLTLICLYPPFTTWLPNWVAQHQ
jgi:tripartite ATP-independent transporter DctM subunit